MKLSPEEEAVIRQRRKKTLPEWKPKPLASYTDAEKIAHFDKEYAEAARVLAEVEKNGHTESNDEDAWAFEARMFLLGPGVWDYYNAVVKLLE